MKETETNLEGKKLYIFTNHVGVWRKHALHLLYTNKKKKSFIYREIKYKLVPASFYFSFLLTKQQNDKIPQPDRVGGSHKVI